MVIELNSIPPNINPVAPSGLKRSLHVTLNLSQIFFFYIPHSAFSPSIRFNYFSNTKFLLIYYLFFVLNFLFCFRNLPHILSFSSHVILNDLNLNLQYTNSWNSAAPMATAYSKTILPHNITKTLV